MITFEHVSRRYRERLAAIAQSSSNALRNLPAQYLREMDAVRQAFQTRGDLSGVMAATSEPVFGSVMARAPIFFPVMAGIRYFCFNSSLPKRCTYSAAI